MNKPTLRYFGGKNRVADKIINLFPPHQNYVEPFGGSAAVLMRKPCSKLEVYNDLDDEIVNFFKVLRDKGKAKKLAEQLELTPYSRTELRATYADDEPGEIERARRLAIQSLQGYGSGGACRNRKIGFRFLNPGHSMKPWKDYPGMLSSFAARLRNVVVECADALEIIPRYDDRSTLYYLDPPYVLSERTAADTEQYRHEMTDINHIDLLKQANTLKGKVIISGYENELYSSLLADWNRETFQSCTSANNQRTETLWYNFEKPKQLSIFSEN